MLAVQHLYEAMLKIVNKYQLIYFILNFVNLFYIYDFFNRYDIKKELIIVHYQLKMDM